MLDTSVPAAAKVAAATRGREAVVVVGNPDGSVSVFRMRIGPLHTSTEMGGGTDLSLYGDLIGSELFEGHEAEAAGGRAWLGRARELLPHWLD